MARDRNGHDDSRGRPSADYTGETVGWNVLAEKLGELARSMQDETGLENTLTAIVHAAAETVPCADEASISAVRGRREVRTVAGSGELAPALDRAQYETGQGRCRESLTDTRRSGCPTGGIASGGRSSRRGRAVGRGQHARGRTEPPAAPS